MGITIYRRQNPLIPYGFINFVSCPHAPEAVSGERTYRAPTVPYPGEVVVEGGEIPDLLSKTGKKARILKMLFDFYRKICQSFVDLDVPR